MITRIRVIKPNEQSDAVANLHAVMRAAGLFVDAAEERERRAGPSTERLVREFQQNVGLSPSEDVIVDEPTAAAINEFLERRGMRLLDTPRMYSVLGKVRRVDGSPVRGATVVAFDQDLRLRSELGRTRTDPQGEYLVWYDAASFSRADKGGADLVVEIRSERGDELLHTTDVLFNAPLQSIIDITLASEGSESEFERLERELTPLLEQQQVGFDGLEETDEQRDVTFLANETGTSAPKLADFAISFRLRAATQIDAPFWYALLRTSTIVAMPQPGPQLPGLEQRANAALERARTTTRDAAADALKRAIASNLVPKNLEVDRLLDQFDALKKDDDDDEKRGGRRRIWKRWRKQKREVTETTRVLDALTFENDALVAHLTGRGVDRIDRVRELAAISARQWEELLERADSESPSFIAGENDEEKRRNHAALLEKRFRMEFPTAVFAGRLENALAGDAKPALSEGARIAEFLRANPEFDLASTSVDAFVKKRGGAGVGGEQEPLVSELKAAQRVFKLAPRFEAVNTLLADGVHSAQKIYRMGKRQFIQKYGRKEGFDDASAGETYERAAGTWGALVTMVGDLRATQSGNEVAVLETATIAVNTFPNIARLFGKADICECEDCRSIFGPAAFFADVMQFLEARDSVNPPASAKQVLFERRPDLGYVELSCENSFTPLPYVDLVNELLEDRVAPPTIFTLAAALEPLLVEGVVHNDVRNAFPAAHAISATARVSARDSLDSWVIRDGNRTYRVAADRKVTLLRQTRGTAEELAANPEYVNDAAYVILRGAKRPLALPFDLPVEEIRAYLAQAGVKRAELMRVFRGNAVPNDPTNVDINAEAVGISKGEQDFILVAHAATQHEYWGGADTPAAIATMTRVDAFLDRTRLEYADLQRLLSIPYVNPGFAIRIQHLDESCDTAQKRIQVLDGPALDRMHRFLRLWRKLGWKMWEVGLVIGNGDINNALVERLKPFLELKERFPSLSIEQLVAFFADINTTAKFTEGFEKPEPSLYEKLFLNKRLINPIDPQFAVAVVTGGAPPAMSAHLPPIVAALRTAQADLEILRALRKPDNTPYLADDRLRLSNLSALYRHATLARLLRIKPAEWEKLLRLAAIEPFASPQAMLDFVKYVERIRASGLTTDALRYVLAADTTVKAADPLRTILTTLTTLRTALQAIATANDPSLLPPADDELAGAIAAHLQTLGWPEALALSAVDIFFDRNQTSARVAAGMPPNFAFDPAITSLMPVGYDDATTTISFTGFMTDAQRDTLLNSLDVPAAVRANADYQSAVLAIHAAPRRLLKFFRPRFTAALARLPEEVKFATQLPKALAAKIAYDAERRQLSFFGIMTAEERGALQGLSGDAAYTAAIAALFNAPGGGAPDQLWLAPADLALPLEDNMTANLTLAATRLANFVIRTLSKDAVVQQFAAALRVSEAMTETLVTSFALFGHPVLEDFTDPAFVASTSAITNAAPYVEKVRAAYWLHRVALVLRTLKATYDDLGWIARNHAAASVTSFAALPVDNVPPAAPLMPLVDLADLLRLHHQWSDGQVSLLAVIERLITDGTYTRAQFATDVEALTGWPKADVETLANRLDLNFPADYRRMPAWRRLQEAFAILLRLDASALAVLPLAGPSPGAPEAAAVKGFLRGRVDDERWLQISKEIQDRLRERKRDSLVAYLLTQAPPVPVLELPTGKWTNANDLFAYLLIDVEMGACQPTSRIVQASAAAQLFVQRAFMGFEPKVVVNVGEEPEWEQWAWMKYYRVWEANRRVFAYPENYVLPELRRDRSEIFKKLEEELLQKEINRDNVETAFLHYLERLDEVSHLEVSGLWYDEVRHVLHVFARTAGTEPRTYYYRRFDSRRWSAWEKVDCDIQSDFVSPMIVDDRLYLVWPEFREEPQAPGPMTTPAENTPVTLNEPPKVMNVFVAMTQFRSGKWTPKKVSQDKAASQQYTGNNFDRTRYALLPLDLMGPDNSGAFLLWFVDTQSTQQSLFNLTGCRGYPELISPAPYLYGPRTSFERDGAVLRAMKNVELAAGDPLVAQNNVLMTGPILGLTPEFFRITYSHSVSQVDKLFMLTWLLLALAGFKFAASARRQYFLLSLGTFRDWFYADREHTFFARPVLVSEGGARVRFYPEVIDELKTLAENISSTGWWDFIMDAFGVLFSGEYKQIFSTFYHPLVCRFTEELNRRGIPGLMDRKTQFADKGLNFLGSYAPTAKVHHNPPAYNYPDTKVDFSPSGSYAMYNWELFYHAPMMIADRLSKNQRFEDAMRWYHFIFDPTGGHAKHPLTGAAVPAPQKYWITKPFFERQAPEHEARIDKLMQLLAADPLDPAGIALKDELERQVADWRRNPFDPHYVAQFRTVAYQKTTVMKYVENLIAWGDQRFRMETLESVNEATALYVLAAEILGERPRRVPPAAKPVSLTYNELEPDLDAFSNALIGFENLIPPVTPGDPGPAPAPAIPSMLYFCIPQNDQLLELWDVVDDRLYKIRHCLDIEGGARNLALFAPRIDPAALVRAAASGADIGSVLADLNAPLPFYRFPTMVQKANELVNDLKSLGGSLLAALEKKDAEAMATLRQGQELAVLEAVRNIKRQQIEDAQSAIEALEKSRELATIRRDHYNSREFMNAGEITAMTLAGTSLALTTAGTIADVLAGAMFLIPDFKVGASGFGGSPHFAVEPPTGQKIGQSVSRGANGFYQLATILDKGAAIATTVAGFQRRSEDWQLQLDLASKELEQIDRQLAGARVRKQIAETDLENQDLQIANAKAMAAFMREKYTNEELYQWMIGQISQTYFQTYQLAYDMAKRAERCYRYELGVADSGFVRFGSWDSLRSGLQAGERLGLDLRRLESSYLDQNRRELEVTKHVSLAMLDPRALVELRDRGRCFVSVPEELFDLDYPGHYFRRIKSVSLSIPCIAGPHTTVSCTLRLLTNSVRTSASAQPQYERNNVDGVPGDDDRFRESHVRIKSIAMSSAQNDSGMFELNFRDERYLPFEGAGVISRWSIELTQDRALRQFAYDTISDVILHVRYTAREDAGPLRDAAVDHLKNVIEGAAESGMRLHRMFDLEHEFPTEWYAFFHPAGGGDKTLRLPIRKQHFPYFAQSRTIDVQRVSLHVVTDTADAIVAQLAVDADPAVEFNLEAAGAPANARDVHSGAPANPFDVPLDEAVPWTVRLRKDPGDFNAITAAEVKESYMVVEYTVSNA